jgi:hypothetical protein
MASALIISDPASKTEHPQADPDTTRTDIFLF